MNVQDFARATEPLSSLTQNVETETTLSEPNIIIQDYVSYDSEED